MCVKHTREIIITLWLKMCRVARRLRANDKIMARADARVTYYNKTYLISFKSMLWRQWKCVQIAKRRSTNSRTMVLMDCHAIRYYLWINYLYLRFRLWLIYVTRRCNIDATCFLKTNFWTNMWLCDSLTLRLISL